MASKNDPESDVDAESGQHGGVQSVDRALMVLEILARDGHAGVSEIAAAHSRPHRDRMDLASDSLPLPVPRGRAGVGVYACNRKSKIQRAPPQPSPGEEYALSR